MVASRRMHWLRCILLAGLCYSLVLQTLLVQARGIAAAGADPQFVLCHGAVSYTHLTLPTNREV